MAICWFLRISSFNYEVFHGSLLTGDFFFFFFNGNFSDIMLTNFIFKTLYVRRNHGEIETLLAIFTRESLMLQLSK